MDTWMWMYFRFWTFILRMIRTGLDMLMTIPWRQILLERLTLNTLILIDLLKCGIYKVTKIVRALWLAERSVCMRVCKHGCALKMFCFSRANHASTNLKKFSSSKLDKFTSFTHSFVGWNLENRYKESVPIFFRLSWHFKRAKSVFWKASF